MRTQHTQTAENVLWQTEVLFYMQIWSHTGWRLWHRQGGNPNRQHQNRLEQLNEIKQNCIVIGNWQTQNKFKTKFPYENNILDFKSRMDYFYIWNQVEKNYSIRSDIVPNNLSDHHMISLSLKKIMTN